MPERKGLVGLSITTSDDGQLTVGRAGDDGRDEDGDEEEALHTEHTHAVI